MGNLINLTLRDLERVIYYSSYVVIEPGKQDVEAHQLIDEDEYLNLRAKAREEGDTGFRADLGAPAVRTLLERIDVRKQMAADAIGVYELENIRLFLRLLGDTVAAKERRVVILSPTQRTLESTRPWPKRSGPVAAMPTLPTLRCSSSSETRFVPSAGDDSSSNGNLPGPRDRAP